jgi:hypothetical protein
MAVPAEHPRQTYDRCFPADDTRRPVCPASPPYVTAGVAATEGEYPQECSVIPVVSMQCGFSDRYCGDDDGEAVHGGIFVHNDERYSGYLVCTRVETLGMWGSTTINPSCGTVFRRLGTTARPLIDTLGLDGWPRRIRGHGLWYEGAPTDYGRHFVQWDRAFEGPDKTDGYGIINLDVPTRRVRMFIACANP